MGFFGFWLPKKPRFSRSATHACAYWAAESWHTALEPGIRKPYSAVMPLLGRRFHRLAGKGNKRTERCIDRLRGGKCYGDIRCEHDDIRALRIALRILAAYALAEVVLRFHIGISRIVLHFAHTFSFHGRWPAGH